MAQGRPAPPLRVFISYSHEDEKLCDRFLVHLSQLRKQGLIEPWHDRRITPSADWSGAIDESLNTADIVILLVSPDFLASEYCHAEMTRALERSQKGEARVSPVILTKCDWKHPPLAKLQVLPKDGKPVDGWPNENDGFDDVVKGLRRLIGEICDPPPVGVRAVRMAVRKHPWRWAIAGIFAALLITFLVGWNVGQQLLKRGTDLLKVGRYADARPALERAKFLHPFSRTAGCALRAAELGSNGSDKQPLDEAIGEFPNCAYLKVLRGDWEYLHGDLAGAFTDYQEAVQREPRLAEAHFDMGRVLDLQGKPDSALPEYQLAAKLSPGTPRYHHNLADLYFRGEEYGKAIQEYGLMGEFPLAALELGKIYRLQGKLEDARGREEDAISWLKNPGVQNAERQNGWAFEVNPIQEVRLGPIVEKQCYADLELALTWFVAGDEGQAATAVPAAFEKCSSRRHELKEILSWESHRLGGENQTLAARSERFAGRFLDAH
jgi:tetratricopeptide (TPR) repeat protein